MKLIIKAKVNARKNEVEKLDDGRYLVHTTALPIDDQANKMIIELLSDYFGIAKSRLYIAQGSNAHVKVVQIN